MTKDRQVRVSEKTHKTARKLAMKHKRTIKTIIDMSVENLDKKEK